MTSAELKREWIKIPKEVLKHLLYDNVFYEEEDEDGSQQLILDHYTLIESKCTGADDEDGGGDYDVVIQRVSDEKFFQFHYSNWDIQYNFERDFAEDLYEVYPKRKTITIYE